MKLEDLEKIAKARTGRPWRVEYRDISFGENNEKGTLENVLNYQGSLGAEILGPEEPLRGDFTVVDAKFIEVVENHIDELIEVALAAYPVAVLNIDGLLHDKFAELRNALRNLESKK